MAVLGQVQAVNLGSGAGLGIAFLATAVVRLASTTLQTTATSSVTLWVFVLSALLGELFGSPLYSFSFALCALYSLYFPSVTEWSAQKYFLRFW